MNDQPKTWVERWTEQLAWLDGWFQAEKAVLHDFSPEERGLFDSLAPAWLAAEAGAGKIDVLESASERFRRDRVLALIEKLCADETRAWWTELVAREGSSIDDLMRLLWEPLSEQGFEFTVDREPGVVRIHCTHCPQYDLAAELGATEWLYALVCATDPHAVRPFDPPIRFQRTKTLMQGDGHCDHTYFVDSDR
jgi:predicted ArsR family transcriptional regulator